MISSYLDASALVKRYVAEPDLWALSFQPTRVMTIPNPELAVVDIRKLREYCLSPTHDEGKHKAHLFATVLGLNADDAEELRQVLLRIVRTHEAQPRRRDQYGQRYAVDFVLEWRGKQAMIRSGWIIEHGSNIPKLTTCYPL